MNTHDIDQLIDKIEASAPMDIAGRSKHIHDLRAALQSQDREDAERLDWLLRKLPGDAIRYCVGVLDDTADIDEFREAIDQARRIEGDGNG